MTRAEALRQIIDQWLKQGSHRTRRVLSEKSGVNYSSIRNAADGREINDDTALRIIMVILKPAEIHDFAQKYIPDLTVFTKALVEYGTVQKVPVALNQRHFELCGKLSVKDSTSLSELVQLFGVQVENTIEELIDVGWVEKISDEPAYVAVTGTQINSIPVVLQLAHFTIDQVDAVKPGNLIYAGMGQVNWEGVKKIFKVLADAREAVESLIQDPKHAGSCPIWYSVGLSASKDRLETKG